MPKTTLELSLVEAADRGDLVTVKAALEAIEPLSQSLQIHINA